MGLASWLDDSTEKQQVGRVAFFVEAGHQNGNKADAEIRRWSQNEDGRKFYGGHTFVKKVDAPLVQAADLLVWQAAKFMKDKLSRARGPRRDFLSLMHHPHAFAYVVLYDEHLIHSIDNARHLVDPFRDLYIDAVFSDTDIANDIVKEYHRIAVRRTRRGLIEL